MNIRPPYRVTHSHTSLGPQGDLFIATFTSHCLKHGQALRSNSQE